MLTLPADRFMNVLQNRMLRDSIVEKEVYEATKKAKDVISRMAQGLPPDQFGVTFGSFEPPVDGSSLDDDVAVADPTTRRHLGTLQAETLPSDDELNPFPHLERPLG